MIRMINNTKDGFMDAYSEAEAVALELKGWSRFVAPEKAADAEPVAADKPKRGRPFKVTE